jgi:hypothetical protein
MTSIEEFLSIKRREKESLENTLESLSRESESQARRHEEIVKCVRVALVSVSVQSMYIAHTERLFSNRQAELRNLDSLLGQKRKELTTVKGRTVYSPFCCCAH